VNKLFTGIFVQFREFYKSLGPTKKLAIIASVLIGISAALIMSFMAFGSDFAPLLTNIPGDQVSSIISKLKEKNIPFKLENEGNTISVPKELLHSTQMTLMSEMGSNKMGSMGLEIFDKQDFSANSYTQKVNYQRALQGELTRAINSLSSVKQSKVILALPNKKTFLEEGGKASASVVVELHQGKELGPEQIRGIKYLVSNAVEGMDPENVTVLDERGKVLTRKSDGMSAGSDELSDLKSKVEKNLEERIEHILSKVVGQAKVVAKVDATLNNKSITAVEEILDPEKTAIRSEQSEEESLDGSRTNPAGVPGARANLPGAEENGQVGFKQDVKKEMKTKNYEVPKTVRNIKEVAGGLERLSVAVIVDGVLVETKKEDGTTTTQWNPRTPEEIKKYEDLVKNTIGFNTGRGDSVKIESVQFQQEDFNEANKIITDLDKRKIVLALLRWGIFVLFLVLLFFVIIRPFAQWITDSFRESVEDMLPRTIEELEELQAVDNSLPGMSAALPILQESLDPEKAESELLKDRIISMMQKDEEKAGSAFGMWLVRKEV
jgi:flagellar M-ring protein FliF